MKYLIINADDFGLNSGVNSAVRECLEKGLVTDVSLMPAGGAFPQAVSMLKEMGKREVGAHLVIGHDLKKQAEKVLDSGFVVTHLDSHQHLHMLPWVFRKVCELAVEFRIPYVRITNERHPFPQGPFDPKMALKLAVMKPFISSAEKTSAKFKISTNDSLWGYAHYGKITEDLLHFAANNLTEGITEIIVHPRNIHLRSGNMGDVEVLAKADLKRRMTDRNIRLVSCSEAVTH